MSGPRQFLAEKAAKSRKKIAKRLIDMRWQAFQVCVFFYAGPYMYVYMYIDFAPRFPPRQLEASGLCVFFFILVCICPCTCMLISLRDSRRGNSRLRGLAAYMSRTHIYIYTYTYIYIYIHMGVYVASWL